MFRFNVAPVAWYRMVAWTEGGGCRTFEGMAETEILTQEITGALETVA